MGEIIYSSEGKGVGIMDTSPARINDRFRKRGIRDYGIRRKMKALKSFVNFLNRGNHSHKQENARRVRQMESG